VLRGLSSTPLTIDYVTAVGMNPLRLVRAGTTAELTGCS
jgi:hypothetical protein